MTCSSGIVCGVLFALTLVPCDEVDSGGEFVYVPRVGLSR